ncbi:MAG: ferredoxin-type protein NapF [Hyphomicrobiales bacterium]|nr:ferredoxin-type protein NapF [Hyphomicrobiales bacterium]
MAASRRALFGRLRGGPMQLRPPWTGHEDKLLDVCTRCGACIGACPTKLLVEGHGGYPIVDFTHGATCTFCGACADACEDDCFHRTAGPAWGLKAALSPACIELKGVTCRRCEEACDLAAIRFRPRIGGGGVPVIDAQLCNGCGACVPPCPVNALSIVNRESVEAWA